jgi:hypothetical protein
MHNIISIMRLRLRNNSREPLVLRRRRHLTKLLHLPLVLDQLHLPPVDLLGLVDIMP